MHDVRSLIQAHYGSNDLIQGMMATLAGAGHDIASPTVEMLNLVDQVHMGGLNSTKDQAELVGITSDMRVLDAGCGVGGSSRYLAHKYGCQVEAIDQFDCPPIGIRSPRSALRHNRTRSSLAEIRQPGRGAFRTARC